MSMVTAISCATYDEQAVREAVDAAWKVPGAPELRGRTLLLKPNIVFAAGPERAVATHPAVLRAVIRHAKDAGAARVIVGESPGYQGFEVAARAAGLMEVIRDEGVEWDDFSRSAEISLPEECSEGALVHSFTVAAAAVEADVLVSLPKLKTHGLLQYSGAIKNLFGCVRGLDKAAFHLRFPEKATFGKMIVDLYLSLAPDFALMDAIVGMEGPGPGNGKPRDIGLLLGSADFLALDRAACRIIGYDPDKISYLVEASSRRGTELAENVELLVDASLRPLDPVSLRIPGYLLMPDIDAVGFQRMLPPFVRAFARKILVKKPIPSPRRCTRCGGCMKICPAGALSFVPDSRDTRFGGRRVAVDRGKCIRCYCCHEICPHDAIDLRRF